VHNEKLYIVGDGEVVLSRRFPLDHQDTFLTVLGVGECFGELSLLSEQINQITVRAHPHATIYTLPKERVAEFVYTQPIFTLALCEMLADRLRVFLATIGEDVRPGMRGDLATIPVVDLVQALTGSRRTGTLVLSDGQREGRLIFDAGKLVGVSLSGEFGEEHFYTIAAWKKGHFRFETDVVEVPEVHRIKKETLSLLMEHARRVDETGRTHTSGEYKHRFQSDTQRLVREQSEKKDETA
jgi:CRP-like cAMP-binding protein